LGCLVVGLALLAGPRGWAGLPGLPAFFAAGGGGGANFPSAALAATQTDPGTTGNGGVVVTFAVGDTSCVPVPVVVAPRFTD
jgi:hypothetical protein